MSQHDDSGDDSSRGPAPAPRKEYGSPEELLEDVNLDLAERERLLREWKDELGGRIDAEAEGMSASDPMSAEKEAKLAAEMRRVSAALDTVVGDRGKAVDAGTAS